MTAARTHTHCDFCTLEISGSAVIAAIHPGWDPVDSEPIGDGFIACHACLNWLFPPVRWQLTVTDAYSGGKAITRFVPRLPVTV